VSYCLVTDLLTGKIPTPTYLDTQKVVDDAADEMDSYFGSIYVTPIVLNESTPAERPWRLLMKRINVHLASGRLIMAAASGNQDDQVHAYAQYLVRSAEKVLQQIQSGEIQIPFQSPAAGTVTFATAPIINNLDDESNVEAFYDKVAKPGYYPLPTIGF
jgi:phage gp36-like protein